MWTKVLRSNRRRSSLLPLLTHGTLDLHAPTLDVVLVAQLALSSIGSNDSPGWANLDLGWLAHWWKPVIHSVVYFLNAGAWPSGSVFSVPCSISIPIPIPLTEITCHFHSVPVLSQYFYSRSNSVPASIFVPFPFRLYFEFGFWIEACLMMTRLWLPNNDLDSTT